MTQPPPLPAVLHGLWRIVPSPMLTEMLARGGLDFQILDCEHGAYDYATLLPDILACERHGCAPWIRVSGTDKVEVQRCLDLGARGLVFPQLAEPDAFAAAAAMMDYAPVGTRGFNPFVRAGGYGMPGRPTATAPGAGRPWFVPIVETLSAAHQIGTIAQIERIDMVYIGVYDLSAQLGCAGQMDSPELARVVEQILIACARAGKPVGMMALSAGAAGQLIARGVRGIVHGVESHRVTQAMHDIVASAAAAPPISSPGD